jgi:hypothetical protein
MGKKFFYSSLIILGIIFSHLTWFWVTPLMPVLFRGWPISFYKESEGICIKGKCSLLKKFYWDRYILNLFFWIVIMLVIIIIIELIIFLKNKLKKSNKKLEISFNIFHPINKSRLK